MVKRIGADVKLCLRYDYNYNNKKKSCTYRRNEKILPVLLRDLV